MKTPGIITSQMFFGKFHDDIASFFVEGPYVAKVVHHSLVSPDLHKIVHYHLFKGHTSIVL